MTREATPGYEVFVAALGAESGDPRLTGLQQQQGASLTFEEREIHESKRVIYTVDALVAVRLTTAFPGALPAGLTFTDTRAEVRAKLGMPAASEPSWDRYDHPGHSVRVQYADNRIELIALTMR